MEALHRPGNVYQIDDASKTHVRVPKVESFLEFLALIAIFQVVFRPKILLFDTIQS